MKIFFYFIDAAVVNAYILYKETNNLAQRKKPLSHLAFRSALANELIGDFCSKLNRGPTPSPKFVVSKSKFKKGAEGLPVMQFNNVTEHMPTAGTSRRLSLIHI